jgi:putative pyruvate formate lyase activating enzyme
MTLESMKNPAVLTDVWLPDFKFGPGRCAMTLAKTPLYWETVTRNIDGLLLSPPPAPFGLRGV